MKIVVTGRTGQVATALSEIGASVGDEIIAIGRPELDLTRPDTVADVVTRLRPDLVVNAAAYTAVDQAESEPDLAEAINGAGAGAVAAATARIGCPLVHLSTDYVFDGKKPTSYTEADPVAPLGIYGKTKLSGERKVIANSPDHVILRTAWVYAANGKNFVRTMLRLGGERGEIGVVSDQRGSPTYAPDIAAAILRIARNLLESPGDPVLRGTFHLAGQGETDWASFAEAIFGVSSRYGGPTAVVRRITTRDYPTRAERPANSRLDCTKLAAVHGVVMPHWQQSLDACVSRLLEAKKVVA